MKEMRGIYRNKNIVILLIIAILYGTCAWAENSGDEAQANNPLANITAFNLQNYYIGELTESDEDANQFWLRYAKPFSVGESSLLLRASLPLNSFPTPPDGNKETGLGDLNLFTAYLFDTGNPAISFGFGPQLTIPSATEDVLGSEKWSAGLVMCCSMPVLQSSNMVTCCLGSTALQGRAAVPMSTLQLFNRLHSIS